MHRSRLLLGIASVLAGTGVLFVILGTVINLVFLPLAIPFGIAAYFLWQDATGRLADRLRARVSWRHAARRRQQSRTNRRRRRDVHGEARSEQSAAEARGILGVDRGADAATIRQAYREHVKEVHPDTEGGDEQAFKRVTTAYETLRDD